MFFLQYFKCILSNAFLISSGKSGNALHEVLNAFPFICDMLRNVESGSFCWEDVGMGCDKRRLSLDNGNGLGINTPTPGWALLGCVERGKWGLN